MAPRTLTHLYPTYAQAVEVVADLTALGIPADDVSMIESETDARLPPDVARDEARNPAVSGAVIGAAIGGALGALVGVGAVAVPYTASLVDLGWWAPLLVGAAIGAVIGLVLGAVFRVGVAGKQAHTLAEGLQRGQHLVMVRVDEAYAAQVQAVLDKRLATPATPEPAFDEDYVPDTGNAASASAAIHREERRIQYE